MSHSRTINVYSNKAKALTLAQNDLINFNMADVLSYCRNELVWSLARLGYYLFAISALLTGGLTAYLLAPIGSYIFFGRWNFIPYLKFFPKIMKQGYWFVGLMIRNPGNVSLFEIGLSDPPMSGPDRNEIRISKQWEYSDKDCTDCTMCCKKLNCPLVASNGNCLSYNTFFWRYFLCGRFPQNQKQIDFYECRKWAVRYN